MPDIAIGAQIFDLVFHPTESLACVGLLTGEVQAFSYDEQGNQQQKFSVKPSKRSCRGLTMNNDGTKLWAVGKGKMLRYVKLANGKVTLIMLLALSTPLREILSRLARLLTSE